MHCLIGIRSISILNFYKTDSQQLKFDLGQLKCWPMNSLKTIQNSPANLFFRMFGIAEFRAIDKFES
jgi:hypothetical protein